MALVESQQTSDNEYKNISNLMKSVLKKHGLTENELKVYDHLIKNGPLHANQIGKDLNIYRTEIYRLLNSLQSKKIVDLIYDKPSKFVGIDYAKALDHLISAQIGRLNELRLVRNSLLK
ncbi:MAG: helix-turn-helix domain-containing protein [Candidatus Nitrosopumilus sp. bin_7KS]